MARRFVLLGLGFSFLLAAVMLGIDSPVFGLLLAVMGLGLIWQQARIGLQDRNRPRDVKPQPPPEREPNLSDWGSALGERISAAISDSVRAATQNGIEAGFETLEEHIERAIDPPRRPAEPAERKRASGPLQPLQHDEAYAHAVSAARAAGLELSRTAVIPVDVGLIVYEADGKRTVHRTTDIMPGAAFLQPFIQLNMPTRAVGLIRYELIDSDGQAVFIHEEHQSLERGVNLLMPTARLRTHSGLNRRGSWRLVVSADGVTLLNHAFAWGEDTQVQLRRHLHADGELTPEARSLLEDETSGPSLSLEDLLMAQENNSRSARQ